MDRLGFSDGLPLLPQRDQDDSVRTRFHMGLRTTMSRCSTSSRIQICWAEALAGHPAARAKMPSRLSLEESGFNSESPDYFCFFPIRGHYNVLFRFYRSDRNRLKRSFVAIKESRAGRT